MALRALPNLEVRAVQGSVLAISIIAEMTDSTKNKITGEPASS